MAMGSARVKLDDADGNREADPQNEFDALVTKDLALQLEAIFSFCLMCRLI